MSSTITDEQITRYREDSVVVLRNLFDSKWLDVLAEGIKENLADPSRRTLNYVDEPANNAHFFYDAHLLGSFGGYDRLMLHSPMAEAVARLMGSTQAILFYLSVFVRAAGTKNRTPWHQDQPSWSASGDQACSAWMSLDPVPVQTALEFVRGSHRWPNDFERPEFFQFCYEGDDRSRQKAFPDIEAHRQDYDILGWQLEPGDCLVFHGMTAHGGSGNLPPELGRRSVSVQWLGDDARFRLLAGRDDPHISEELQKHGVKPGGPVSCDICPVAWSQTG
jgi:ectoine hydroxylase-related dioxygenase (phytanoyl-CoA dioxygenase family)